MTKLILVLGSVAVIFSLHGCNTLEGIGKDLRKGGEAIEKAAKN